MTTYDVMALVVALAAKAPPDIVIAIEAHLTEEP